MIIAFKQYMKKAVTNNIYINIEKLWKVMLFAAKVTDFYECCHTILNDHVNDNISLIIIEFVSYKS